MAENEEQSVVCNFIEHVRQMERYYGSRHNFAFANRPDTQQDWFCHKLVKIILTPPYLPREKKKVALTRLNKLKITLLITTQF